MEASTAEPFTLGNIWNTSKVTVGTPAQVDTCAGPRESNWQVLARPALHVADKESEAQRGPGLPKDTPLIINTHVLIPVSSLVHGGAHPNRHPAWPQTVWPFIPAPSHPCRNLCLRTVCSLSPRHRAGSPSKHAGGGQGERSQAPPPIA